MIRWPSRKHAQLICFRYGAMIDDEDTVLLDRDIEAGVGTLNVCELSNLYVYVPCTDLSKQGTKGSMRDSKGPHTVDLSCTVR
jgi:hypothetical protein